MDLKEDDAMFRRLLSFDSTPLVRESEGRTVAINAIHLDRIPEFSYDLLWWERCIRSVANVTRRDAREFIELAASIPIRADIELHPLADGNIALQTGRGGNGSGGGGAGRPFSQRERRLKRQRTSWHRAF